MSNPNVVRSTALRAGGACVRCRKGKTKCVYENGRAPCKNCAKGMHECYLPSESMAHHHGQSPARHQSSHRQPRESLPGAGPGSSDARQPVASSSNARHVQTSTDKLTPELIAECERVVSKTFPACVAFHKPSFVQQIKAATLEPVLIYGLLTCAARSSATLIRRYGGPTPAAEYFAAKTIALINGNIDHPTLADIQALCLLIIHEWGSRNAVRAYIYLGQAVRMMHMYKILDSHNPTSDDQHHPQNESDYFLKDESLRRTLWLVYILDCFLTSSPGRHPALTRADLTNVALPCTDINFAFGNTVYVKTLAQHLDPNYPHDPHLSEVGEFGHIVVASMIWRDTIDLLQASPVAKFNDKGFAEILVRIEELRHSLPMQFKDKPGQVTLHMTMGSGYTFAMLHCLLHCASVFVSRRRLLQDMTNPMFNIEDFKTEAKCRDVIDHLFGSCHTINGLLLAIEAGTEKDHNPCFPIFMLFASFTASATIAYLSLKGLTPAHTSETSAQIVQDGLRLMNEGTESWPLMASWLRHLAVMQRVITNGSGRGASEHHVKEENSSNGDAHHEPMEYDQHNSHDAHNRSVSEAAQSENDTSMQLPRRPGFSAINGGASASTSTPGGTQSPPAAPTAPMQVHADPKQVSPNGTPAANGANGHVVASQDMTGPELCAAFERQLLEMDDLAAFMGGGV